MRILATTDVHMHITGWDALRDRTVARSGMDVLAHTITAARAAARGDCVLVDNGDALQGTPEGNICAQPGVVPDHPWPAILNALAYDAAGLGNHDFDFGLDQLEQAMTQAEAPVLCASIPDGSVAGVVQEAILHRRIRCSDGEVRPLALGITSVLPPQTEVWNHRHLHGRLHFDTGVVAARAAVERLRAGGADLVLVLCHAGLCAVPDPMGENFATAMAAEVPGIDAMVLGHTHKLFPAVDHGGDAACDPDAGTVHGVPAVMPGFAAVRLGVIDLGLHWTADGWQVAQHSVALMRPDHDTAPDATITDLAAPAIAATQRALSAPLAHTPIGFHSYFEMLQSGTATALIADVMRSTVRRAVDGTALAALPLVAAVSPMAVGGQSGAGNYVYVPPGKVCERHLVMLGPYQNAIWAVVLTGAELWDWAERSAVYFGPTPGALSPLVAASAPSYNFDALHGLRTVIDPFRPARYDVMGAVIDRGAQRVVALTHEGTPVQPTDRYLVAMTSYRAAGGGVFPGIDAQSDVLRTEVDLTQALRRHMLTTPFPDQPAPTVWRFADGPPRHALVDTAPDAARHLEEIAPFEPQPMGLTDRGFLRMRVTV
ncbi:MAG: 5'-nucleotidase C-terminal domain-containing protein [Pseudomonadota bacterium]